MENPRLIKGGRHEDNRGVITFNNDFDLSKVKRSYTIMNSKDEKVRGWQGHKIEQRWFTVIQGAFEVEVVKITNWDKPTEAFEKFTFALESNTMDVLSVPKGHMTLIKDSAENSIMMVYSDYYLAEVEDEYRFEKNYFQN